jgi:hypothetical protein
MSMHYFFILGWDRYGLQKKGAGTRYAELVFLYPVGSAGHVVHSSAFGMGNIDAILFILGWVRYSFHKKHVGSRYSELVFLHPAGYVDHVVHFGAFET